jgi:hypothetical protein
VYGYSGPICVPLSLTVYRGGYQHQSVPRSSLAESAGLVLAHLSEHFMYLLASFIEALLYESSERMPYYTIVYPVNHAGEVKNW